MFITSIGDFINTHRGYFSNSKIGSLSKERTIWETADNITYRKLWDQMEWPVYSISPTRPGSDVAAEVATAMALSSLIDFGILVCLLHTIANYFSMT